MSSVVVIDDDEDEFYAGVDLDAIVASANAAKSTGSQTKGSDPVSATKVSSKAQTLRSELRSTLFDLFGYSEVKQDTLTCVCCLTLVR